MSRDEQIVVMHEEVIHRRDRQIELERLPIRAVIQ